MPCMAEVDRGRVTEVAEGLNWWLETDGKGYDPQVALPSQGPVLNRQVRSNRQQLPVAFSLPQSDASEHPADAGTFTVRKRQGLLYRLLDREEAKTARSPRLNRSNGKGRLPEGNG